MNYIEPYIDSSYRINNIGKTLYETVLKYKPKVIVEFGVLYGYSAICMAQALDYLQNKGHIYAYDLWENYKYKHSTKKETLNTIKNHGVDKYIHLWDLYGENDIYSILKYNDFDLVHIDISNDGEIIERCYNILKNTNTIMLFEGGTEERDNVEWMKEYNKTPICPLKQTIKYEIINDKFPSLSLIKNNKTLCNLEK